jgi:hypothetical protein
MKNEPSVLGLFADEPIGMEHPLFMARTEARMRARLAAQHGVPLEQAIANITDEINWLFGEVPAPLVTATVTTAYLEAAAAREGERRGSHD